MSRAITKTPRIASPKPTSSIVRRPPHTKVKTYPQIAANAPKSTSSNPTVAVFVLSLDNRVHQQLFFAEDLLKQRAFYPKPKAEYHHYLNNRGTMSIAIAPSMCAKEPKGTQKMKNKQKHNQNSKTELPARYRKNKK